MSYGARRQSNAIELLSAWKVGSCGSEKRDMGARGVYGAARVYGAEGPSAMIATWLASMIPSVYSDTPQPAYAPRLRG